MNSLIVREAQCPDAQAIGEIHVRTWQNAYRGQVPDAYLDSLSIEKRTATWQDIILYPKPFAKTFVGSVNGDVIGFCSVGKSRDDDATPETGEMYAIYIDPDFMGKGVGSALMQRGLEHIKESGFTKATLWVLESNRITRRFYEHKGWTADGAKKTDPREGFELREVRYERSI
jgi:ribosomal protein S18 acetylase RimI-like enzyme